MTQIEKLEQKIEHHNKLYWEEDANIEISDEAYDLLVEKLRVLNPDSKIFKALEVQESTSTKGKYTHKKPMLSLDKFYSKDKAIAWMKKVSRSTDEKFQFELKLDGISGKLEDGNLATRGNGKIGENHTDKIPYLSYFSDNFNTPFENPLLNCIGEILITDTFFENNLKDDYKNSRNACAGLMGKKDPEYINGKGLTFVDYNWSHITRRCTVNELKENWDKWVKEFKGLGLPYDGLVIKVADKVHYESLGYTSKFPKGAIAFKFANKSAITKVKSITWQVGRTGRLTPVAELEPIDLAGVTISRATGHNFDFINEKGIVAGCDVVIERAGDVIPKIIEVVANSKSLTDEMINFYDFVCPCCDSKVEKKGVDLICTNDTCPDRMIAHTVYMAKIIGIDELGAPTAEKLNKMFDIFDITDFYSMSYEDLVTLEGYGEKSARTLDDNIQNALKDINEIKFIASFGIENVGRTISDKMLTYAKNIPNLLNMSILELMSIDGIGEKIAQNFYDFKISNCLQTTYEYYRDNICEPKKEHENVVESSGSVCFTGTGELGRKEYDVIAKEKGLTPTSSVNAKLTYLVTNDLESNSGKMKKARKGGVNIISYEAFMEM